MHILSPETDNFARNWQLPFLISGKERMTVENSSWSISTKECCRPSGCRTRNLLITQQSNAHPTELPKPTSLESMMFSVKWTRSINKAFQGLHMWTVKVQISRPNMAFITKTCLYFDPLKPHFYRVKLGFTGAYIIFLISAQNIDCEYSLELPRQGGSNEYPRSMFWAEIWKYQNFFLKIFIFWW